MKVMKITASVLEELCPAGFAEAWSANGLPCPPAPVPSIAPGQLITATAAGPVSTHYTTDIIQKHLQATTALHSHHHQHPTATAIIQHPAFMQSTIQVSL